MLQYIQFLRYKIASAWQNRLCGIHFKLKWLNAVLTFMYTDLEFKKNNSFETGNEN
jgi:hypothetical protein